MPYRPKTEPNDEIQTEYRRYKIHLLKDEPVQFLYKTRLANKIRDMNTGAAEEMYTALKYAIYKAAYESLETLENTSKPVELWLNENTERLIEESIIPQVVDDSRC